MGEVKHDGGPAFPVDDIIVRKNGNLNGAPISSPGMSLRDWFAGQALAGICANSAWNDAFHQSVMKPSAEAAYAMADAMLAARKATPSLHEGERG